MTSLVLAIGNDPGPKAGLAGLLYSDGRRIGLKIAQVSPSLLTDVLGVLIDWGVEVKAEVYVGVERFVHSNKGGGGAAGKLTREQVGAVLEYCASRRVYCSERSAVTVKAWATDKRLEKVQLLPATTGMPHARDAARHALFTAVHDGAVPDPLSRRARA